MALTQKQQDEGFLLGMALFNSSLSYTIFNEYAQFLNSGGSIDQLYINLTKTDIMKTPNFYPDYLTSTQIADKFLTNLVSNNLSTENYNIVKQWLVTELDKKIEKGTLFKMLINALNAIPETDVNYGQAVKYLHKKIEVAKYYTLSKYGTETDILKLQQYVSNIKHDTDISSPEKIDSIIESSNLSQVPLNILLTEKNDNGSGGIKDDNFYANSLYNSNTQKFDVITLSPYDILDGRDGNDSLTVSYSSDVNGVSIYPTTKISNIENILINHTHANANNISLDLMGVIGAEKLTIDSTGGSSTVDIKAYQNLKELLIKGKTPSITINETTYNSNSNKLEKLSLSLTEATTLTANVQNLKTLELNQSDKSAIVTITNQTNDGTFNLNVSNSSVNMTNAKMSDLKITASGAIGNTKTVTINNSDTLKNVEVIGNHAVTVALQGGAPLETLTLNGNSMVTINSIHNTTNLTTITSNTDSEIATQLNVKATYNASDKKDSITIYNHETNIDLKNGDDTLTINTSTLDKNVTFAGGLGTDILVLAADHAQTLTSTTAFNDKISGFEWLKIKNDFVQSGQTFNIDMKNVDSIKYVSLENNSLNLNITNFVPPSGDEWSSVTLQQYSGNLEITHQNVQNVSNIMSLNLNESLGVANNTGSFTSNNLDSLRIVATDTDTTNTNLSESISLPLIATNLKELIVLGNINVNLGNFSTTGNNIKFLTTKDLNIHNTETFSFTFKNNLDSLNIQSGNHATNYDTTANNKNNTFVLGNKDDIIVTGNGNNSISSTGGADNIKTGTGNDNIYLGVGNSTIDSGTGIDLITLGTGNNTVIFNKNLNGNIYTEVTNMNKDDVLKINTASNLTFNTNKVLLTSTATFTDYLNEATKGAENSISWFQYQNHTYVTVDKNNGVNFDSSTDGVIKFTGLIDLSQAGLVNATGYSNLTLV